MTTISTGRLAEHLVCAELGRRGLIATTFTHNVPKFDVIVAGENCRTFPIQVKGTNDASWTFEADKWMEIKDDKENQTQIIIGEKLCATPDLIWICVAVKPAAKSGEPQQRDQFFICIESDIQKICVNNYRTMLEGYAGRRPRNWESRRYFWNTDDLTPFENKWATITDRMQSTESPNLTENNLLSQLDCVE